MSTIKLAGLARSPTLRPGQWINSIRGPTMRMYARLSTAAAIHQAICRLTSSFRSTGARGNKASAHIRPDDPPKAAVAPLREKEELKPERIQRSRGATEKAGGIIW
jgi:hypothetical protein